MNFCALQTLYIIHGTQYGTGKYNGPRSSGQVMQEMLERGFHASSNQVTACLLFKPLGHMLI